MYAIVQTGGHQYKVAPGDTIEVERLDAQPGSEVTLGEVLMVSGDNGVQVGSPFVGGAEVVAKVITHDRGPRLVVFKYKPKKRYRRRNGHRQDLTRLAITDIRV